MEKTSIIPPNDLRSYAYSGGTDNIFHSEVAFVPSSLHPYEMRTPLLAHNNSVTSTQCGDVIMPFQNEFSLKSALLVQNNGYNFVSTGRLAEDGTTIEYSIFSFFRRFDDRVRSKADGAILSFFRRFDDHVSSKADGFVLGAYLSGMETGMYMLPELQSQVSP